MILQSKYDVSSYCVRLTSRNLKLSQLIRQLVFLWSVMSKILDWKGLKNVKNVYIYPLPSVADSC